MCVLFLFLFLPPDDWWVFSYNTRESQSLFSFLSWLLLLVVVVVIIVAHSRKNWPRSHYYYYNFITVRRCFFVMIESCGKMKKKNTNNKTTHFTAKSTSLIKATQQHTSPAINRKASHSHLMNFIELFPKKKKYYYKCSSIAWLLVFLLFLLF